MKANLLYATIFVCVSFGGSIETSVGIYATPHFGSIVISCSFVLYKSIFIYVGVKNIGGFDRLLGNFISIGSEEWLSFSGQYTVRCRPCTHNSVMLLNTLNCASSKDTRVLIKTYSVLSPSKWILLSVAVYLRNIPFSSLWSNLGIFHSRNFSTYFWTRDS